jgi:putative membrane protein
LQGVVTTEHIASVVIFGAGCAVGLLGFSKLLRWLLGIYESTTMAALCGFMVGSLRKIWPFKQNVTLESLDQLPLPPEYHIYENVWPDHFSGDVGSAIALAVLGAAAVLTLDYLTRASRRVPHLDVPDDAREEAGVPPPGRP